MWLPPAKKDLKELTQDELLAEKREACTELDLIENNKHRSSGMVGIPEHIYSFYLDYLKKILSEIEFRVAINQWEGFWPVW